MFDEEMDSDKAIGQFRFSLREVMDPLQKYGQGDYVFSAIEEIISLALQLHLKLSGVDIPFHVNNDKLHW